CSYASSERICTSEAKLSPKLSATLLTFLSGSMDGRESLAFPSGCASAIAAGSATFVGESFKDLFGGEKVFRGKRQLRFDAPQDFFRHVVTHIWCKVLAATEVRIDKRAFLR